MTESERHRILNVLRNPYGISEDELREVRLAAADIIEKMPITIPVDQPVTVTNVVNHGGLSDEDFKKMCGKHADYLTGMIKKSMQQKNMF